MPKQRLNMTINKLLLATSLGLVLAACAGEQADTTTADAPAAGEMPQTTDQGVVTGSPEANVIGPDPMIGDTTADATLGDPMDPNAPATTVDPMQQDPMQQDPMQTTDPMLDGTTETDTTTPPPSQ